MLVSHSHRFVYLKTNKTAGTSVELYFEPYCVDPAAPPASESRAESESRWGIVGYRGPDSSNRKWFNHMSAAAVRDALAPGVWGSYFKFAVVRNPYDVVVSAFWWRLDPEQRHALAEAPFDEVRSAFAVFAATAPLPPNGNKVAIDGELVVDRVVRFERLEQDVEDVCAAVGVPWRPERLGRFKAGTRMRDEPFASYYDAASARRVEAEYAWELDRFGYGLPVAR